MLYKNTVLWVDVSGFVFVSNYYHWRPCSHSRVNLMTPPSSAATQRRVLICDDRELCGVLLVTEASQHKRYS